MKHYDLCTLNDQSIDIKYSKNDDLRLIIEGKIITDLLKIKPEFFNCGINEKTIHPAAMLQQLRKLKPEASRLKKADFEALKNELITHLDTFLNKYIFHLEQKNSDLINGYNNYEYKRNQLKAHKRHIRRAKEELISIEEKPMTGFKSDYFY